MPLPLFCTVFRGLLVAPQADPSWNKGKPGTLRTQKRRLIWVRWDGGAVEEELLEEVDFDKLREMALLQPVHSMNMSKDCGLREPRGVSDPIPALVLCGVSEMEFHRDLCSYSVRIISVSAALNPFGIMGPLDENENSRPSPQTSRDDFRRFTPFPLPRFENATLHCTEASWQWVFVMQKHHLGFPQCAPSWALPPESDSLGLCWERPPG